MAKDFKLLHSEAKANVLLSMSELPSLKPGWEWEWDYSVKPKRLVAVDYSMKPKRLPHWWDCTSDPGAFTIKWQSTVPSISSSIQEELRHTAYGVKRDT